MNANAVKNVAPLIIFWKVIGVLLKVRIGWRILRLNNPKIFINILIMINICRHLPFSISHLSDSSRLLYALSLAINY